MTAPDPSVLLRVEDLTVIRPDGVAVFEGAGFEIRAGETVLFTGPSGSGKSTLFDILAGLRRHGRDGWTVRGRAWVEGKAVDLERGRLEACSLVFQDFALFDELSPRQNIAFAAHHGGGGPQQVETVARALMPGVELEGRVSERSGGEQQRVAVARTLFTGRPILLLDEANARLDVVATRKLADLIEAFTRATGRAVIVVAHHFETLMPVVGRVLLLDPHRRAVVEVPTRDAGEVEDLVQAIGSDDAPTVGDDAALAAAVQGRRGARGVVRPRWLGHYLAHYLWTLCASPWALVYMVLGGVLVGFVSTWFTFKYFPEPGVLIPLLHDDTLSGIGFVQFRVLVPVVASMLLASRNGALVAAEIGHRVKERQFHAMRILGIPAWAYVHASVVAAMVVGAFALLALMYAVTAWVSMRTWIALFPGDPVELWQQFFFAALWPAAGPDLVGLGWVAAKTAASALAVAAAALWFGGRRKASVLDINAAIAQAIVVGLSLVLVIHTVAALLEFRGPGG